ncbi:hypothetical protein M2271_007899 [Streptomyces sp. LBL]|uniref:hypothetical protein n=1 Tax=Streptomyces sp. LBL TaxID=2940562 RepID=UPI0024734B34|nr:hypothetical protein [Streptomyces sp. LBL]MDH6630049.1 hypothetical protein [Streptomyces sp. LBL]
MIARTLIGSAPFCDTGARVGHFEGGCGVVPVRVQGDPAAGLAKNRIGAPLRDTAPVLAALGHTVPTGPLAVTTAQQLAGIAGHDLTAP